MTQAFFDTLAAVLLVAGPLAVGVTKVVDFARNLFDEEGTAPSWVWNALAFVVGLVVSFGWGINLVGAVTQAIPALAETTVGEGWLGTALTGIALGAMASFWHDKMAQWAAWAAMRKQQAPAVAPATTKPK